jgi:hypothetical protein
LLWWVQGDSVEPVQRDTGGVAALR